MGHDRRDAVIRFEHVEKAFGSKRVLADVSFDIQRGETFCLLGRSGVGKSVTLKLLMGLVSPDRGSILVNDEDMTRLGPDEMAAVRKKMGFLFQQAALFDSISVGENVAFPLRRHRKEMTDAQIREVARAKLSQVGLAADYDKMPSELSGGMRKRAGLARALALDPEIVLADEPSAGLDPITSAEIDELLIRLKIERGATLLVVTHNIPSARRIGDELAFIDQGAILARGTVDELEQSDHHMVREFLKSQTGG